MPKCDRCKKPTNITTMSYFNTQMICIDCAEKERQHPDYQKAKDAEHAAVLRGDYNFKGIGYPDNHKSRT